MGIVTRLAHDLWASESPWPGVRHSYRNFTVLFSNSVQGLLRKCQVKSITGYFLWKEGVSTMTSKNKNIFQCYTFDYFGNKTQNKRKQNNKQYSMFRTFQVSKRPEWLKSFTSLTGRCLSVLALSLSCHVRPLKDYFKAQSWSGCQNKHERQLRGYHAWLLD